jgi:hypothetical protein
MLLLMFRSGTIEEIPSCSDVVHRPGSLVCLDSHGGIIASVADEGLLYYTLNPDSIQTILMLKRNGAGMRPVTHQPKRQLPESALERLWRMRKRRQVNQYRSGEGAS